MTTQTFETTRFGPITIGEDRLITFVEPILGFNEYTRFTLLDHQENSPFNWLQSLQNPDLAFVVTNPKLFNIPYEFTLPQEMVTKLALKNADEALVLTIVNIPPNNPSQMTANLLGPIVVNRQNLKAMQVILPESEFNTRTRLLPDSGPTAGESQESKPQVSRKD